MFFNIGEMICSDRQFLVIILDDFLVEYQWIGKMYKHYRMLF